MNINRRSMLKRLSGAFGVAVAAATFGHVILNNRSCGRNYPVNPGKYTDKGIRLIRPPGALPEEEFLAGCIRCYKCQDACEVGAIGFFTENSGKHYHTPYVDPSVKPCTLCMKCTHVCPTGVLTRLEVADRDQVDMASVELKTELCLSYKAKQIRDEQALLMQMGKSPTEATAQTTRRGPCGECYMVCPVRNKAIKLEPGGFLAPIVFKEHCVGCGLCEDICRAIVRGDPAIRVVPNRQSA